MGSLPDKTIHVDWIDVAPGAFLWNRTYENGYYWIFIFVLFYFCIIFGLFSEAESLYKVPVGLEFTV